MREKRDTTPAVPLPADADLAPEIQSTLKK
jgi:hypothetical protein